MIKTINNEIKKIVRFPYEVCNSNFSIKNIKNTKGIIWIIILISCFLWIFNSNSIEKDNLLNQFGGEGVDITLSTSSSGSIIPDNFIHSFDELSSGSKKIADAFQGI